MTTASASKSKLVPLGALIILFAFTVSMPLEQFLARRFRMTLPLALIIDGLKSTIFWGPGVLLIGLLRERRAKKIDRAGR